MPATKMHQLTIEKTPCYYVTMEAAERIKAMSRDVKLLVVVRDPVTRALSDYAQSASKRIGPMKPFEDIAMADRENGIVNTSWGAVRLGVYVKPLKRWFQHFSRSQLHFVSGEQLVHNPAQVLTEVQVYLGLTPVIGPEHFYVNSTRGLPCLIKDPVNHSKPHCLGKSKGRTHPKVAKAVLNRLREFYRPFNEKFYRMVNKNFGWM